MNTPITPAATSSPRGFTTKRDEQRVHVPMHSSEASAGSEPVRGFTLLIAVVMTSVILSVGLALLDIAYKQVVLSSVARQSQVAFYAADSAMECALFWDQKMNVFRWDFPGSMNAKCGSLDVVNPGVSQTGGLRTTTFDVPCVGGGISASVIVTKTAAAVTNIYANGYSTCNVADPRRIERGLKVFY